MKYAKKPVRALRGDATRERAVRGRARADARFPVPPRGALPVDYSETLDAIQSRIRRTRMRVARVANSSLIQLYWDLGRMILQRQEAQGWGARVIDRLAEDLRAGEPGMKGLSGRNLLFMRSFAEAYPDAEKVKQLVSRLPWGHVIRLLQRVKEADLREWYMRECIRHGWSRSTLELQLAGRAHQRRGKALTNFKDTLPPAESDMAVQVFKDPYLFDFLGMADMRREREVEQALVDHIQHFLLELGSGFAFVGRQVHLEFASRDFHLDLLFYHLELRRYVVVELKAVPFEPAFIGQINVYLSAVDDLLRHPDDKPTIGLLLCRSKEKIVVEYALRDLKKPIRCRGVGDEAPRATASEPRGQPAERDGARGGTRSRQEGPLNRERHSRANSTVIGRRPAQGHFRDAVQRIRSRSSDVPNRVPPGDRNAA